MNIRRAMLFAVLMVVLQLLAVVHDVPSALANSRITFGEGNDQLDFEGRLTLPKGSAGLDPTNQTFVIQLTAFDGTVLFRVALDGGMIAQRGSDFFMYRDAGARAGGGIAKVTFQRVRGAYRVRALAYGDLATAESDMVTDVFVGSQEWSTLGRWEQRLDGWRLRAEGTVTP
jgi:hypothetical protein